MTYAYPVHYLRWRAMKYRCYNKKSLEYKRYGLRGIKVCAAWLDFKTFQKWCIRTHEAGKTIDRINNDGNYSPKNCRWATASEQQANSRKTPARRAGMRKAYLIWMSVPHPKRDARLKKKAERLAFIEKYGTPKTRGAKTCPVCRRFLKNENFYRSKDKVDGLMRICKRCALARK